MVCGVDLPLGNVTGVMVLIVFSRGYDQFVTGINQGAAAKAIKALEFSHAGEEVAGQGIEIVTLVDRVVSVGLFLIQERIIILIADILRITCFV